MPRSRFAASTSCSCKRETLYALLIALVAATGFAMAFQSPTNTELSKVVGNAEATLVSFAGGTLVLGVLVLLVHQGNLALLAQTPPWQWLGGLYGVFIVLVITYAVPALGVALTLTAIMFGEIAMGMVIDTFGWFASAVIPFSLPCVIGCAVIAVGIALVYYGQMRTHRADGRASNSSAGSAARFGGHALAMLVLSLAAGVGGACQAPTNATLGVTVGTLEASFVSFAGGTVLVGIYALIVNRGKLRSVRASAPWTWLGGLYGAAGVFVIALATPAIGVGIAVTCVTLGQLAGGLAIDGFGLMRCEKIHLDRWRIIGMLAIAAGILLATMTKLA